MSLQTTIHRTPPFTLTANPDTDIWAKPPSHRVFTAPTHPSPLPFYSLSSFQRARITFSLPPAAQLKQYDQAGLVLVFRDPNQGTEERMEQRWIKTGIEFYYGKPYLSTVGCDGWADWSVAPLPAPSSPSADREDEGPRSTIEVRREKDPLGKSLWVYHVVNDREGKETERSPLREVNWVFAQEEGVQVGVGGYVCRPSKEGGSLEGRFEGGVEVEVLDG